MSSDDERLPYLGFHHERGDEFGGVDHLGVNYSRRGEAIDAGVSVSDSEVHVEIGAGDAVLELGLSSTEAGVLAEEIADAAREAAHADSNDTGAGSTHSGPEERPRTDGAGQAVAAEADGPRLLDSVDALRCVFEEDVQPTVDEFADGGRRGDLDADLFVKFRERLVELDIAAEDVAEEAGAIDAEAPEWLLQERARDAYVRAAVLATLGEPEIGEWLHDSQRERRIEHARRALEEADELLAERYEQ